METNANNKLQKYLSPIGVWALAFGCSVGWGSFVMPGSTFLKTSGPLGVIIGMIIGAIFMFIIGANYHYLMNKHSDAGGAFTYVKKTMGIDHAFLNAWFVVLMYIAVIWANITALTLIMRNVLPNSPVMGIGYDIAGYHVDLLEVLICMVVMVLSGLACLFSKKLSQIIQTIFAIGLIGGVIVIFILAMIKNGFNVSSFNPQFREDSSSVYQIFSIIVLAPWAFVGFESVSHSTEEFKFSAKKGFLIMAVSISCAAFCYIALSQVAISVLPEGVSNWKEYIDNLANFGNSDVYSERVQSLPTLFASFSSAGKMGVVILGITMLCGILTGVIGNMVASSRLLYSMSNEGMLPTWFSKVNKRGVPKNAIIFIVIFSSVILFLGRTAIGWIVDVTTISASIVYGFTSFAAYKEAKQDGRNKLYMTTGIIGISFAILLAIYFLVPTILAENGLSNESFLILIIWSIIGTLFFRFLYKHDKERKLGKSIIVWITLFFLIFYISHIWMRKVANTKTEEMELKIEERYENAVVEKGGTLTEEEKNEIEASFKDEFDKYNDSLLVYSVIQMVFILITLCTIFNIYFIMQKREKETNESRLYAEGRTKAKSAFLANMTHDLRTPMNAIVGYTNLAKEEEDETKIKDYLDKIDSSSKQLLALINDILDMSRIESGKMELELVQTNITHAMENIKNMFATQMDIKHIDFNVNVDIKHNWVLCDKNRIDRVCLNLISNAYKFTPEYGKVTVSLKEDSFKDEKVSFTLSVKDTGIGMSKEFAEKVFESFERERNKTVDEIQGTGLGMAITKNIIDLMNGTIEVITEKGKGTEFVVKFTLDHEPFEDEIEKIENEQFDYNGIKVLLVDDNPINCEIAQLVLESEGFLVTIANNGKEAVEIYEKSNLGDFDIILMDIMMPVLNGYEATDAIRKMDGKKSSIPIIALSANAFAEDVAESKKAGMNAHVAKPIDVPTLLEVIKTLLFKKEN